MTALYHAYTQTVSDGTATSVVRPSDWNSAHVQGQTLSGNTAGASSFTGTNFVLQGGNNVTLSAATAAGAATIIISGANTVAQTVQTQASGAIAGTGFTSTTTAGTAVTAAMGTNGLSMAVPQFITTYVNDLTSGRAGTGFTSTTTAGTAVTAALGTNGLSMAVPAFITTYVNDLTSGRAGTGFTSTTTAGTAVTAALGTNGLSMAVPAYITTYVAQTTQTQPAGNIAGVGTTLALTNITGTLNVGTNGVALSLSGNAAGGGGAALQGSGTYTQNTGTIQFANSNGVTFGLSTNQMTASVKTDYAGTGYTSTTQAGSTVGVTQNTAGLSMAWPPFITTATQSTQTQASGAIAGTGFTSTTTAGTAITAALGTNGLNMAVPQYITTYVNDLTSGRAGTGFTSTTTAGTAITAALGTNGLSMAVPAYITTYVAQTTQTQPAGNIAGTGTTLALTNITGTLNVGTNGVALSLSGNAGGAGGGIAAAVDGTTVSNNTLIFNNANGVSFGINNSTLTASIIANQTYDGWAPYADLMMVAGQQGQGTLYMEPEHSPYYFQDRVGVPIAYSNATNSTGSVTLSYWMGFYTQNGSTLSLSASTSATTAFTFSGTVASYSLYSGMRLFTFPWSLTVPEGEVYIGHLSRTATAGANASISQMLVSNVNSNFVGFFGQSHNTTQQWTQGQGVYTATTSGMPNSIAFSQLRGSDSNNFRAPAVMFINSTV